jgi:hypothetical protein
MSGKGTRGDVAVLIFAIVVGLVVAVIWKLFG